MGGSGLHPYVEVCKGWILGRDLEGHIQASALGRKGNEQCQGIFHLGEEGGVRPAGTGDGSQLALCASRAERTQYGLFSAVALGAGSSWPVYIGVESWLE